MSLFHWSLSTKAQQKDNPSQSVFFTQTSMIFWIIYAWFPSIAEIFFLWRPFLKDPKDDMVLELAVEAEVEYIVTHNLKDFNGVEHFGIKAITPKEFLQIIGEIR